MKEQDFYKLEELDYKYMSYLIGVECPKEIVIEGRAEEFHKSTMCGYVYVYNTKEEREHIKKVFKTLSREERKSLKLFLVFGKDIESIKKIEELQEQAVEKYNVDTIPFLQDHFKVNKITRELHLK